MKESNTFRLKSILESMRTQIVCLKDIQLDYVNRGNSRMAEQLASQISALEVVYSEQVKVVSEATMAEPKKASSFKWKFSV